LPFLSASPTNRPLLMIVTFVVSFSSSFRVPLPESPLPNSPWVDFRYLPAILSSKVPHPCVSFCALPESGEQRGLRSAPRMAGTMITEPAFSSTLSFYAFLCITWFRSRTDVFFLACSFSDHRATTLHLTLGFKTSPWVAYPNRSCLSARFFGF